MLFRNTSYYIGLYVFCLAIFQFQENKAQQCGSMPVHEHLEESYPAFRSNQRNLESITSQKEAAFRSNPALRTNSQITIPVVVHILYHTASENISDEQVQTQLDVLNQDFSKNNADAVNIPAAFSIVAANSNVQFCLAKRTPDGKPTSGITRTYTTLEGFYYNDFNESVKFSAYGGKDAWDRDKYLNIWVCTMPGSVAGYAQFPGGPALTDGVVIGNEYFGTIGTATNFGYKKGRVTTHEVGHWLNLRHIWGDAQCGNDYVFDTPVQERPNFGCLSYPSASCNNASDMFMNYMDYTWDDCKNMFTEGQAQRMNAALTSYRSGLLTSDGCTPLMNPCGSGPISYYSGGATFDDGSGLSNYYNNQDCSWLIQPASGGTVSISFNYFSTEAIHDTLVLYDGENDTYPVLGKFSGGSIPADLSSSGGSVFIRFKSNGANVSSGWSITYQGSNADNSNYVTCGGTATFVAASGTVADGSGNSSYSRNLDCKFLIQPPGANFITLTFTSFNTELDYDLVKVYDGDSEFSSLLGVFSGSTLPPVMTSSGGSVFISFVTDDVVNKAGWSLNYTINDAGPLSCAGTTSITQPSGILADGSGSSDYSSLLNCFFHIQPVGATTISLHFNSFDVEADFDSLVIYDGPTSTYPVLGVFSGNSLPPDITSSTGEVLLNFVSDEFIVKSGWELSYTSTGAGGSPCIGTSTFTAASGTISDGSGVSNYVNNTDCKFLIAPTGAASVTLTFSSFDTELGFDQLKVYNGPGESYPLIGTYSGNSIPPSITAPSGAMYLQFTTDALLVKQGWEASYTSSPGAVNQGDCSGLLTFVSPSGKIADGSGRNFYKNNSDCKFLIQPAGATSVTLEFLDFHTEQDFDFVKVYDGTTTSAPLIGSFSGIAIPSPITSSGGAMLVQFISDQVVTEEGWYAVYNSTVPGSMNQCNGLTNVAAPSGTLSDGSGNSNYSNGLSCQYRIQPPGAINITLNFTAFETENVNDYVKVYDGATSASPLLGTFSGINLPPTLVSTGGALFIEFVTDQVVSKKGWSANYYSTASSVAQLCSGLTSFSADIGTLSDGSGAYNYSNDMNCTFLINPSGATSVKLHFLSFNTESGFDYVRVYNGSTTASPLIGAYSGATIPSDVTANSGVMLVEFVSNSSNTRSGWEATYTVTRPVNTMDSEEVAVGVFPNPGTSEIMFKGELQDIAIVKIHSVMGELLFQQHGFTNDQSRTLSVDSWPSGVYFIIFETHFGKTKTIRYLKQ